MPPDCDLIREFVARGSDDAFRTLVERHSGMVHSAARRILADEALAQEVTQAVFIILARKAHRLPRNTILAGWLYRTARFVALEAVRAEKRRQHHHQEFAQMNATAATDSLWKEVAPLLEEAVCRLGDADRNAIVLRFFEEKSFGEVANALATTEAAAKMRVGRALEKLRTAFARRGVAVPAGALVATLSAHSAAAAPAGLSATVASVALAKPAAMSASLIELVTAALKALAWSKAKSGLLIAAGVMLLTSAAFIAQQQFAVAGASPPIVVANLDPLLGDWAGTFEMRTKELSTPARHPVTLSIRPVQGGHGCEIDMRVANADGQAPTQYRFSHTLNESGDHIQTADDRQIARMTGVGSIIESVDDRNSSEWRVAFRTPHANAGGYTDCLWFRKGRELTIIRRDNFTGPQSSNQLETILRLQRQEPANAQ